jgi:hypothetical protein
MSVGPAYKSFVVGECTPEVAATEIEGEFKTILYKCMYNAITHSNTFYRVGYQKYLFLVRSYTKNEMGMLITEYIESVIKYFYNRQLIVQMTMTPQKCGNDPDNPYYVSVPLYKAPSYEIQTDILQLQPDQWKINYNMKYLVVIVDTFSRFVWTCPVEVLEAKKVQKAFITALMRPGQSMKTYKFIREKIQRVVVDGGSEFKNVFPEAIHLYFPNAQVITSNAKNRTGNRPTGNGPIEAAIRLLRRVIRDYSLAINPNFLQVEKEEPHYGLNRILFGYNNTPQIVLHNKTPYQVMQEIMNPKFHEELDATVTHVNNQRNNKIIEKQQKQALLGKSLITRDRHGPIGYRIYEPPKAFAKEVDIRVSLKVYVVDRMDPARPQYVDLIEYGEGTDTKQNVLWNSLVLVKTPVDNGPPSILHHFTTTVEQWGFQKPPPQEISQPFYITKNIVEAIAGEPDEHVRKRQMDLLKEPLTITRRSNKRRRVRDQGNQDDNYTYY